MGRLTGRVALITGAARGQGRSHAVRLAQEGARIIAIDICKPIDTVPYPLASSEDLRETAELVVAAGGEVLAREADVRDLAALEEAVEAGVTKFGRLDVVVANAATVNGTAPSWRLTEAQFQDQLDVALTGVWRTTTATIPTLIKQGEGGSIVLISSQSGIIGEVQLAHYAAAKHGVNGLMRTLAAELAPHMIRVNSVNPTNVKTPMIDNPYFHKLFSGGVEGATWNDVEKVLIDELALPIPFVDPVDISNAVLYLACDEGRFVTGTAMSVDAGQSSPIKVPHSWERFL